MAECIEVTSKKEAWRRLFQIYRKSENRITKLSTRIGEMIAAGEKIKKETEHSVNRYGDKVHYCRYSFCRE